MAIIDRLSSDSLTLQIAVKRLLALDYPMSRLAVTLPLDENGMEVDSLDD